MVCISIFVQVPCCFNTVTPYCSWRQVMVIATAMLFLLRISLAACVFCASKWILGLLFYFYEERHWHFMKISLSLKVTFGNITMSQYGFYWSLCIFFLFYAVFSNYFLKFHCGELSPDIMSYSSKSKLISYKWIINDNDVKWK